MPLVTLIAWLLVLGLLVYLVRVGLPESTQPIKKILIIALVVIALLIVLQAFGILATLDRMAVPRV